MSNSAHTIIKFDGQALQNRAMDVAYLAPALLALGELIKDVNRYANGDRAAVQVLVNADLKQKCFELNVELALTAWEQVKTLLNSENVTSAKEIAEWVGIGGGGTWGLLKLIKRLKGKKIESAATIPLVDGADKIRLKVYGEAEAIVLPRVIYELYATPRIRDRAVSVLGPLHHEGYERLTFYYKDSVFVEFEPSDVPDINLGDLPEVMSQNLHQSLIRTSVKIRKAAYEGNSKWTLTYKKAIEAAFEDAEWLGQFQSGSIYAPPGSSLDVDLEEQYTTNELGEMIGDGIYRVKKVHAVKLPAKQQVLGFPPLEAGTSD